MELIFLSLAIWFLVTFLYLLFWIIGNGHKEFSEFVDETLPCTSTISMILGALFFVSGAILFYLPQPVNFPTVGLSIAALGLATISFSMAQKRNFESKKETKSMKSQLSRIEKFLNRRN